MEPIKFRPLRRIKKTGKIAVASYMQWRKIKSADNSNFLLDINSEHLNFDDDEFVYNHNGEQLFWYNHHSPTALPLNYANFELLVEKLGEGINGEYWKLSEPLGKGFHPSVRGFDCDGVPVFSHYTADYIATHYKNIDDFIPLTVGIVKLWYGWFLYKLENVSIVYSKA